MNEGNRWVVRGKELSVVSRGGYKDASVGPSIGEIGSYIPWEGDMSGKKGDGSIVPAEGII